MTFAGVHQGPLPLASLTFSLSDRTSTTFTAARTRASPESSPSLDSTSAAVGLGQDLFCYQVPLVPLVTTQPPLSEVAVGIVQVRVTVPLAAFAIVNVLLVLDVAVTE
jgi:hypothetical protein